MGSRLKILGDDSGPVNRTASPSSSQSIGGSSTLSKWSKAVYFQQYLKCCLERFTIIQKTTTSPTSGKTNEVAHILRSMQKSIPHNLYVCKSGKNGRNRPRIYPEGHQFLVKLNSTTWDGVENIVRFVVWSEK